MVRVLIRDDESDADKELTSPWILPFVHKRILSGKTYGSLFYTCCVNYLAYQS